MKKKFRKAGFTMMEIMVVVGIIGMLAALTIPSMIRSRASSQASACIFNLRQIDAADNQFSQDKSLPAGSVIHYPNDLISYFKQSEAPVCPAGGIYSVSSVIATPLCSLGTTVTPNHVMP